MAFANCIALTSIKFSTSDDMAIVIGPSWGHFDIRTNNFSFGADSTAYDYLNGICTICGEQDPSLAENATKEPTVATVTDRAVPTGDNSNIAIWTTLVVLATFGAAATVFYERKRER